MPRPNAEVYRFDMRSPAVVPLLALACGSPEPPPAAAAPSAPAPAAPAPAAAAPTPAAEPPPGAARLADPPLLVQRCADTFPCADLLHAAGTKTCAEVEIGGLAGWRLPTRAEAERFAGRTELADLAGYHWTSTPFDDDPAQFWIVDPTRDQPTTVPGDRKPFRIRCVRDP